MTGSLYHGPLKIIDNSLKSHLPEVTTKIWTKNNVTKNLKELWRMVSVGDFERFKQFLEIKNIMPMCMVVCMPKNNKIKSTLSALFDIKAFEKKVEKANGNANWALLLRLGDYVCKACREILSHSLAEKANQVESSEARKDKKYGPYEISTNK